MIVILRVKDQKKATSSTENENFFFGYVYDINDMKQTLTVDTMNKDWSQNLTVVKCKSLMYIRNDIKSMVAIENIEDIPLIQKFLKPALNKRESTCSANLNEKLSHRIDLNDEQKKNVSVITSECLSNRKVSNIMALHSKAGTGKTKVLIESLVNIINFTRKADQKSSILVCAMSNVLTDLITMQTVNHSGWPKNAKLARIGDREKISRDAQKHYVSDFEKLKDYDVIFTTVTNTYELFNFKKDFDICFVDDANCCIDSELAILLQLNITKLFLIGDIMQTQPMAQSQELLDSKYDEPFFARMINTFKDSSDEEKPILTLSSQERMHNELAEIVDE